MRIVPEINEAVRVPPAKKNTRKWCRGKKGVEHTPEVIIPENSYRSDCVPSKGGRTTVWICGHRLICTKCGKVLKHFVRCPDKPEGIRQLWIDPYVP